MESIYGSIYGEYIWRVYMKVYMVQTQCSSMGRVGESFKSVQVYMEVYMASIYGERYREGED